MKIRILLISVLITFAGILAYSLVSTELFYYSSLEGTRQTLSVYMNAYSGDEYTLTQSAADSFSEQLEGARVTFISSDGTVLADSEAEDISENHSEREEVDSAIAEGEGYAVRRSATLGVDFVYYCRKMPAQDGFYLVRIAVPTTSEWALFAEFLPTVAIYLVIDLLEQKYVLQIL